MRDVARINNIPYPIAHDRYGARLFSVTQKAIGNPAGTIVTKEWRVDGPDFTSNEDDSGYLGRDYGENTDGRWKDRDVLGPLINTVTLSTYDGDHGASQLGTSSAVLGTTFILGGAVAVGIAIGQALLRRAGVTHAYIARGQDTAKLRLSNMALAIPGPTSVLPSAATDIVATVAVLATNRREVSVGMGDAYSYKVLREGDTSAIGDIWADNDSAAPAQKFGIASDRVVVMSGQTVKGNIMTGSVTMRTPTLNTVATLNNLDVTFTGFAMDGPLWLLGTDYGPQVLDPDTAEFVPVIPEVGRFADNCRSMGRWFPIGVVVPLHDGTRYQAAGNGESWGVERFLGNSSPVQGYQTGGDGSTRWYLQAVYNEATGDTWLVMWRPRQAGDPHGNPLSPYVIARFTSTVCRYIDYIDTVDGERTNPTWMGGYGSNAFWFTAGRTSREIEDTNYRFAASGTTYLTEHKVPDGALADIETVEFDSLNCAAGRTITPRISINGGAYVNLTAQTTNGFHRVLAVNGTVPHVSLQGATRIKPGYILATNDPTTSPQVAGKWRVRYRLRPQMLRQWHFTVTLPTNAGKSAARTAEELQDQLMTEWAGAPVQIEDFDLDTPYARIDSVTVREIADSGGGTTSPRGSIRQAEVIATSWPVS